MEIYSPDEVAKQLEIKPATLRKYAIMLEKEGYSINRNSQNHRYYTDKDVMTIRRVITGKNSDITLEEVIHNVVSVHEHNTTTNDIQNDVTPNNSDIDELKRMILEQGKQITAQTEFIKELSQRIDQQQSHIAKQEALLLMGLEEDKKKGFFARLFNK